MMLLGFVLVIVSGALGVFPVLVLIRAQLYFGKSSGFRVGTTYACGILVAICSQIIVLQLKDGMTLIAFFVLFLISHIFLVLKFVLKS